MDFDDDNPLFTGLMMADSQISELDLAPQRPNARYSSSFSNRRTANPPRHADRGSGKRHTPFRQSGHEDLSPEPLPFAMSPDPTPPSRPKSNGAKHDDFDSDSWEDDAGFTPQRNMRAQHSTPGTSYSSSKYYSASPPPSSLPSSSSRSSSQQRQQQSTAMVAVQHLVQVAKFGVAASGRLVTLARENQHLAVEAGHQLDSYVLRPCLRASTDLARVYCPEVTRALRDAEEKLRRAIAGGRGPGPGRGSRYAGARGARGSGRRGAASQGDSAAEWTSERERENEVVRLKDRVVEQDALLRDWHQQVRRLLREREALKRRLNQGQQPPETTAEAREGEPEPAPTPDFPAAGGAATRPEDLSGAGNPRQAATAPAATQQQQQLAEQLRQLHVLVDQLVVNGEVSCSQTHTPPPSFLSFMPRHPTKPHLYPLYMHALPLHMV